VPRANHPRRFLSQTEATFGGASEARGGSVETAAEAALARTLEGLRGERAAFRLLQRRSAAAETEVRTLRCVVAAVLSGGPPAADRPSIYPEFLGGSLYGSSEYPMHALRSERGRKRADADATRRMSQFLVDESSDLGRDHAAQVRRLRLDGEALRLEAEKQQLLVAECAQRAAADAKALSANRLELQKLRAQLRASEAVAEYAKKTELRFDESAVDTASLRQKLEVAAASEARSASILLQLRIEAERSAGREAALGEELAEYRKSLKSTELAAARERIRALERLLEKECEGRAHAAQVREQRDSLEKERGEWAKRFGVLVGAAGAGDDASSVARRCLDALRSAQAKRCASEGLAHAADAGRRRAERHLEEGELRAKALTEEVANLTSALAESVILKSEALRRAAVECREVESLRLLLKTFSKLDAAQTIDGPAVSVALKKRLADLEQAIDAARQALKQAGESPASGAASTGASSKNAPSTESAFKTAPQPPVSHRRSADAVRVLHLALNPAASAAAARASFGAPAVASPAELAPALDATKLHARLKEKFREHLNWFREAVYLLTGFRVDMTTSGGEAPRVRLRSMFAEREDDALEQRCRRLGENGEKDRCALYSIFYEAAPPRLKRDVRKSQRPRRGKTQADSRVTETRTKVSKDGPTRGRISKVPEDAPKWTEVSCGRRGIGGMGSCRLWLRTCAA